MTLARNTEAYNLLKGLVESYGANSIRETILLIVGTGDLSDPTHARHLEPGLVPITVDERRETPAEAMRELMLAIRRDRPF